MSSFTMMVNSFTILINFHLNPFRSFLSLLVVIYIGMCRCEGYGFQAVYYSIGYINWSVWV